MLLHGELGPGWLFGPLFCGDEGYWWGYLLAGASVYEEMFLRGRLLPKIK